MIYDCFDNAAVIPQEKNIFFFKKLLYLAELNRGDTPQDKHVKEAKSKCRTIASLLTDAPNPHSKGVLMFKKRRQRSKKYTLTSFGSVDEDMCRDSQEEDGVFPGSESEFDEEGFSAVPDPTWDSDYLDMLEKRATAGTEGRRDGIEGATSPGLSNTTGKGAQLFEQQRKKAADHDKKVEAAQPQVAQSNVQGQVNLPTAGIAMQQDLSLVPEPVAFSKTPNGEALGSAVGPSSAVSPPPVAPKPATASVATLTTSAVPAETPQPESSAINVLNRTARPFTPGFISVRAATAPVTFRPPVAKTSQRPVSTAMGQPPPFSATSELTLNYTPSSAQMPPGPPAVFSTPFSIPQVPLSVTPEAPVTIHPTAIAHSVEKMQSTAVHHSPYSPMQPVYMPPQPLAPHPPLAPAAVSPVPNICGSAEAVAIVSPPQVQVGQTPQARLSSPIGTVSAVSQLQPVAPTPVPGPTGRTGILLEARRRGGKPKPMFNVPEVTKKSPNPDLLSMVQRLDDRTVRQKPPSENLYDDIDAEERSGEVGMGRAPPPVAPKPKVIHETPQFLQAGGKGAELFARRQSRMGMYVLDTSPETHFQQEVTPHGVVQPLHSSSGPSGLTQWKLSPNVRAPPPIGYNPLMGPSIPSGPQREASKQDGRGKGGSQREGIKALDFMRRQPYQLNSAMFNYGGSAANLSALPSFQGQRQQQGDYTTTMVGSSLTTPKQIPIKTARVYEVKRFSTPTPISAPTISPKVIAPRSATTLGERLNHSGVISPPPAPLATGHIFGPVAASAATPGPPPSQPAGLPNIPTFSTTPIPNSMPHPVPTPYTPVSFTSGLQTAKQFKSAPELSILSSLPPRKTQANPVQAPKPRFVATKGGVQPCVWRPGAV